MTEQQISGIMNTVKDCKINFLQHEYYRYSHLIHNEIQHIERIYKENIISINVRNACLKQLSELIRFMNNDVYNVKLKEFKNALVGASESNTNNVSGDINEINDAQDALEACDDDTPAVCNTDIDKCENKNIDNTSNNKNKKNLDTKVSDLFTFDIPSRLDKLNVLFDICKNSDISNINDIMFDDFDKVKIKLLEICKDVGFYSIEDALNILIGSSHKEHIKSENDDSITDNELEFKEKLDLYNLIFVPIDYKSILLNGTQQTSDGNYGHIKSDMEWQLERVIPNSDIYIDSYAEVTLHFPNTNVCYVFGGYFVTDPICCIMRTSQICRQFVYKKKKIFQHIIDSDTTVNDKFALIYIKNLSIGELLSYNDHAFKQKIHTDYMKYISITKMKSFKSQMDEFTKDNNLKNMFNMIKLLLMGPDECINVAGLLFGLTKDKKYGADIIAELIYRRLSYTLQIRLKKSSINLKNELDKLKAMSDSDVDSKKLIAANAGIPTNIKKIIFDKMEEMKFGSSETGKHKLYVDVLSKFPWIDNDTTFEQLRHDDVKCRAMMDNVYNVLKNKVYGHEECKNAIREMVCKLIMNPVSGGKALGLVGPPGVGKTLIAKRLGEALGIPCISISLCGVEDAAVLTGHSFTYSAAQPGSIVRKMVEAGSARCIMFFDELDKSCQKHGVNEIQNVLINVTDPNMNMNFNDKFFDVGFPLNKVIFVFSYNDKSKIDPILHNRIQEIDVKPYTVKDKLKICQEFLMKEILEDIGLQHKSILIDDKDAEYVIQNFTHESGVRELKRKLETIFLKINVDRIYRKGPFKCKCKEHIKECSDCDSCEKCKSGKYHDCEKCKSCNSCNVVCHKDCKMLITPENPIKINHDIIVKYLNKPKHDVDKIHPQPEVGVINGLYATTIGSGGITQILMYTYFGSNKFCLHMSGSQGKVMKESVSFAFTIASNLIKNEYMNNFVKTHPRGIHIHTPDGATPKDGPSAGAAFTTAFISKILNKKIRNDIAMTGEIGQNGNVTKIGGLVYKLRGAKAAGVRLVFVCKENEDDYNEIFKSDPDLFNDNFQVKIVTHVREIIPFALLEDDGTSIDGSKYLN